MLSSALVIMTSFKGGNFIDQQLSTVCTDFLLLLLHDHDHSFVGTENLHLPHTLVLSCSMEAVNLNTEKL